MSSGSFERQDAPHAPHPVLTIGHSRHSIEKLLELLHQHHVEVLVDVRSQPASRFSPHFSRKPLERAATLASIRYLFLGDALGGRPQPPGCYDEHGKVDYDRVEAQPFYQRGIERLLDGISRHRICLLCAEEDPAHCHRRRLVTRTLDRLAIPVHHVRATGALEPDPGFAPTAAAAPTVSAQLELLPVPPPSPAPRTRRKHR